MGKCVYSQQFCCDCYTYIRGLDGYIMNFMCVGDRQMWCRWEPINSWELLCCAAVLSSLLFLIGMVWSWHWLFCTNNFNFFVTLGFFGTALHHFEEILWWLLCAMLCQVQHAISAERSRQIQLPRHETMAWWPDWKRWWVLAVLDPLMSNQAFSFNRLLQSFLLLSWGCSVV